MAADDTISIDPAVTYSDGLFVIYGNATGLTGISKVEISASVDGAPVQPLGEAAVAPDGSYQFSDSIGYHSQASIFATVFDNTGGAVATPATYKLSETDAQNPPFGVQLRYSPNDTNQANPTSRFVFNSVGRETVTVLAPNQNFQSVRQDTFVNERQSGTTFIFNGDWERDAIYGFVLIPNGRDFISLPGADFDYSKASVLKYTVEINGSCVITDPQTKYQVALEGVTLQQLRANSDVIKFDVVVCFCGRTKIRTADGDMKVEDLAIGSAVITSSGAARPIRWLGHRTIDCRSHLRPQDVFPICISAHAFGDHRPSRDLFVSPGHAVCVDVLGEVLIPAGMLVNGSTIFQVEIDEVTYWHVELDSHDIILAENLPAESYLEMGNRSFFTEAEVVALAASPDAPARMYADFCRPFVAGGVRLEAVRAQLQDRALTIAGTAQRQVA